MFAGVHEPVQQGQQLRGIAQLGSRREGGGAHRYERSFRLVALNLNIVGAQKAKYSKPQIDIPGVGRVDFLVGKSLLLECDSRTHHQYRDEGYRRDMAARALGYTPVRLSYRQLFDDWTDTQEYLLRLLRTRRHHRPPRPY